MPDQPAILPAAPDTRIIEMVGSDPIRTPVLFWALNVDNPYKEPLPVTVHGIRKGPCAIEFGIQGMVHDPAVRIPFTDAIEWQNWAKREAHAEAVEARHDAGVIAGETHGKSSSELQIEWITKPFKTNSFYHYCTVDHEFVFQVDGGCNPPKQKEPVVKIKRDEFMKMKKTIDVAEYDDLVEGRAPGMDDIGTYEVEEPEVPEIDDNDLI